jgi:hypothetical protein
MSGSVKTLAQLRTELAGSGPATVTPLQILDFLVTTAAWTGNLPVTPVAATATTIATGGTAITVVTGPVNGGFITNPVDAAGQGISVAENVYVDMVATPGSTDTNGNGTTVIIAPGQTFTIPSIATGVLVKANAATSGHKLSAEVW